MLGYESPLQRGVPSPCASCSDAKCPKIQSLSVTCSSIRTIYSPTLVGVLLPPIKVGFKADPEFCGFRAPVARNACATGLINEAGMVLFGEGFPGVRPSAVKRASSAGFNWLALGTLMA